ncbi:MAG: hypothetical protein MJ151_01365, partial [Lachnospiraceae bacterium]|nr:hypothetical protein [Lachnospiraceae bacterium]
MPTIAENQDNRRVSREAEKAIISCMLQDQDTIASAVDALTGEEFSVEIYRKIYEAIEELSKKNNTNIVMVRDFLISKGEKGDIVDMNFLFAICPELTEVKFGGNFTTKNVYDMSDMFYECSKLESIDLST